VPEAPPEAGSGPTHGKPVHEAYFDLKSNEVPDAVQNCTHRRNVPRNGHSFLYACHCVVWMESRDRRIWAGIDDRRDPRIVEAATHCPCGGSCGWVRPRGRRGIDGMLGKIDSGNGNGCGQRRHVAQGGAMPLYVDLANHEVPDAVLYCTHEVDVAPYGDLVNRCHCKAWTDSRGTRLMLRLDDPNDRAFLKAAGHIGNGNGCRRIESAREAQ
jgi:hypothetical protein